MFDGSYKFFDYKYNIAGYSGQDFGSIAQYIYLFTAIILIVILLIKLRKSSKEKVITITKIITFFLLILDIVKVSWESYYDIKLSGSFNTGLLPFDTCSMIIPAGLLVIFAKGKVREYAKCWIVTGSVVGGIANMLFLNALKYYPFFTFGAFYSMIWHFLMVFIGLLYIVTNFVDMKYTTIIKGFIFHFLISLIIIPIDIIFDFDFMMYINLGGIPIFENVASYFTSIHLNFLNPFMMLILYYISFNIVFLIPMFIKKLLNSKKNNT